MKVLVTGANGQLGYDIVEHLKFREIQHLGVNRDILDLTNEDQVKRVIRNYSPDVVIHCAAYTAVDRAEEEKELCYTVNVLGTRYVAKACKEIEAKMVYISTDYVFDGEGNQPFRVIDKPNPINYYGKTKYEGELEVQESLEKHFIVRIAWVFGSNGNNFVKTVLRLGKERDEISIVADQIGSPTYTYDLAELLIEMIKTDEYGIYHATNEGYCSWYEFACEIIKQAGLNVKIKAIKTTDYPTLANRPHNSRISKASLISAVFNPLPKWQDAVKRYIDELRKQGD